MYSRGGLIVGFIQSCWMQDQGDYRRCEREFS
jgi:hypothetical protein